MGWSFTLLFFWQYIIYAATSPLHIIWNINDDKKKNDDDDSDSDSYNYCYWFTLISKNQSQDLWP
jgi:hypothetical protein